MGVINAMEYGEKRYNPLRALVGEVIATKKKREEEDRSLIMALTKLTQESELKNKEEVVKGLATGKIEQSETGSEMFSPFNIPGKYKQREAPQSLDILSLLGLNQGNLPPGTTYNKGGIRMPLNYEETQKAELAQKEKQSKIFTPSENERAFIADYPQVKTDLESIMNQLTPDLKAPMGGFARIASGKRFLVPEEKLKKIQEPYVRALKTFLFGPGGKALTPMEKAILENAATPIGKSPDEWKRDIKAGYDVMNRKYQMLTSQKIPSEGEADTTDKDGWKTIGNGVRIREKK